MNQNKKLKLWIKIVLYITVVGAISIFVFLKGVEIGKRYAQENIESTMTETDMLVMDEAELEEMEEEVIEKTYVIDPLILVNKKHRLPDDYEVELKTMYDKVNRAAKEAYGPLNDMLAAGRAEGLAFEICSSYRDVTVQERLFQEDVDVLMEQGYTYEEAYDYMCKNYVRELNEGYTPTLYKIFEHQVLNYTGVTNEMIHPTWS